MTLLPECEFGLIREIVREEVGNAASGLRVLVLISERALGGFRMGHAHEGDPSSSPFLGGGGPMPAPLRDQPRPGPTRHPGTAARFANAAGAEDAWPVSF